MGANLLPEPSPSGCLLVCCGSHQERYIISSAAAGPTDLHFCASADVLARHKLLTEERIGQLRGVVLEVGTLASELALDRIASLLSGTAVPLLLRLDVRGMPIKAAVAHARTVADLRLSFRRWDRLEADIERLLSPAMISAPTPSARLQIIARSAEVVGGRALPIVAMAASLGARAISVSELAAACGLGPRTLESRLANAGVMGPKALLQWNLSLHAAWGHCVAQRRPSELAEAMGLSSADVLSDRVERATGLRLGAVCEDIGFEGLLERYMALLTAGSGESRVQL